jgi:RNA polymerase sigma factor (sigma-70 family)
MMPTGYEDEMPQTRRSLLSRLKREGDNDSWQELFDTYWKLVYSVCLRAGLKNEEAQEVVQETFVSLSKSLGNFKYDRNRCTFRTWLCRIVQHRIINFIRDNRRWREGRQPNSTPHDETDTALRIPDEREWDDHIWDEEWERNLLYQALKRVKEKVDPIQYQMFDLYVMKERPVSTITKMLGVNRARIYLTKHRVSKMVEAEARQLEQQAEEATNQLRANR